MGSSPQQDLLRVANEVVEWLRSRHHPEKPHISVVSPANEFFDMFLWDLVCAGERQRLIEEEEEEDVEDIENLITSVPPPWAFGASINVACDGEGSVTLEFRFTVRKGPRLQREAQAGPHDDPNDYSDLALKAEIEITRSGLEVRGALDAADGTPVCNCQVSSSGKPAWLLFLPNSLRPRLGKGAYEALERGLRWMSIRLDPPVGLDTTPQYGICWCRDEYLRAEVYGRRHERLEGRDGSLEKLGDYYHAVGLYVNYADGALNVYLVNLSGYLVAAPGSGKSRSDVVRSACSGRPVYTWAGEHSRWILGYLMEVSGLVQFKGGCSHKVRWTEHGLIGAYPLNTVVRVVDDRTVELRDYVIEEEVVNKPKKDDVTIEAALTSDVLLGIARERGCDGEEVKKALSALARAVRDYIGSDYLYKFQREALLEVLGSLQADERRATVVVAPTAAGKTLAFLLPIIVDFLLLTYCRRERPGGTLYYLLYPTKALANDQLDEVANILYHIWRGLPEDLKKAIPTFGILHGDVKDNDHETPISAPGSNAYVSVLCSMGKYGLPECRVSCDSCPPDFVDFLSKYFRPGKFAVYSDPPNILITDEDMINRILSLWPYTYSASGRALAVYELHLFGGEYKRCEKCGFVYPPAYGGYRRGNRCNVCKDGELRLHVAEPPRLIVLDEAHELHGSFGSQVRYLFATMENHIERAGKGRRVKYVVSSATMAKPEIFVSRLLNLEERQVRVITAGLSEKEEERVNRVHLIVMPRAYTRDNTLAAALYSLYSTWPEAKGIVFTNTLGENNDITNTLRERLSTLGVEVKAHSTDYNRYDQYDDEDRVKIERWFKERREKAVLVATPTMELGVDIGDINFAAVYGLPRTISSFIQRIGRAGRKYSALVLTVANPFNRYDYFFYENYRLLTNSVLRAAAQQSEIVPISTTNREAWLRGVLRHTLYLFKYFCVTDEECARQYVNNKYEIDKVRKIAENISSNRDFPNIFAQATFGQDLAKMLMIPSDHQTRSSLDFVGVVSYLAKGSGRTEVLPLLRNLRGSDIQIKISFPTGEWRNRDAYVFTRRGAPGQVVSFRGRYYAVKSATGHVSKLNEFLEDSRA